MPSFRQILTATAALAVVALSAPQDVSAQPSLVLGGGLSHPLGDMGDALESGYHGRVGVELGIPVFPVAFRADGAVHRFNGKGTDAGTMNQIDGALSAVLKLGGIGLGPYMLAGIGKYRQDYSDALEGADPETVTGYHAGFGVTLGLLGKGVFAEARLVNLSVDNGNARYFPLTVGVRF